MSEITGTATNELSMLKDGTIKRVFNFASLREADRVETGKKYKIINVDELPDTDKPSRLNILLMMQEIIAEEIDKEAKKKIVMGQLLSLPEAE